MGDIYEDLPTYDLGKAIDKLQKENKLLEKHIKSLDTDIKKLCDELVSMKKIQDNLAQNISALYKTAKNELERKDRIIADLRSRLDDLVFKRGKKRNLNEKPYESFPKRLKIQTLEPSYRPQNNVSVKSNTNYDEYKKGPKYKETKNYGNKDWNRKEKTVKKDTISPYRTPNYKTSFNRKKLSPYKKVQEKNQNEAYDYFSEDSFHSIDDFLDTTNENKEKEKENRGKEKEKEYKNCRKESQIIASKGTTEPVKSDVKNYLTKDKIVSTNKNKFVDLRDEEEINLVLHISEDDEIFSEIERSTNDMKGDKDVIKNNISLNNNLEKTIAKNEKDIIKQSTSKNKDKVLTNKSKEGKTLCTDSVIKKTDFDETKKVSQVPENTKNKVKCNFDDAKEVHKPTSENNKIKNVKKNSESKNYDLNKNVNVKHCNSNEEAKKEENSECTNEKLQKKHDVNNTKFKIDNITNKENEKTSKIEIKKTDGELESNQKDCGFLEKEMLKDIEILNSEQNKNEKQLNKSIKVMEDDSKKVCENKDSNISNKEKKGKTINSDCVNLNTDKNKCENSNKLLEISNKVKNDIIDSECSKEIIEEIITKNDDIKNSNCNKNSVKNENLQKSVTEKRKESRIKRSPIKRIKTRESPRKKKVDYLIDYGNKNITKDNSKIHELKNTKIENDLSVEDKLAKIFDNNESKNITSNKNSIIPIKKCVINLKKLTKLEQLNISNLTSEMFMQKSEIKKDLPNGKVVEQSKIPTESKPQNNAVTEQIVVKRKRGRPRTRPIVETPKHKPEPPAVDAITFNMSHDGAIPTLHIPETNTDSLKIDIENCEKESVIEKNNPISLTSLNENDHFALVKSDLNLSSSFEKNCTNTSLSFTSCLSSTTVQKLNEKSANTNSISPAHAKRRRRRCVIILRDP